MDALVGNLTLDEKVTQLLHRAKAIPRINWPSTNWWTEALHGVREGKVATSWPQVIGIGASFNASLFKALGNLTGREGRGNSHGRGNTYWAPSE